MCGFVGLVTNNHYSIKPNLIEGLNEIKHRGPDQSKFDYGNQWAMGFARLSILDLSDLGSQPMKSEDKTVTISFNGEIYNYLELKNNLINAGYTIKGNSDTEILLNYYQYLNGNIKKLLEHCNGMFAFAIIDEKKNRLILARDRLGVKPLFYSKSKNIIYFGSEIKGLRKIIPNKLTISSDAIMAYLRIGFIPSWTCIYNEIENLQSGTFANYNLITNELKIIRYWIPTPKSDFLGKTEKFYKNAINDLLEDATKIRLNADVPLSLFLSGGIDSGIVAAKLSAIGKKDIIANTIRFPEWENDESSMAQETADHVGIKLQIHNAEPIGLNDLIRIIGHFDEPFSDQSAIVTNLVCKKASGQSTVILTGDGGDESFAGYREYIHSMKYNILSSFPDFALKIAGSPLSFYGNTFISRLGERLCLSDNARSAWTHIYPRDNTLENLLSKKWKKEKKFDPEIINKVLELNQYDDSLTKAQIADLSVYLPDNVLKKVDQMSMMHSLEVRSPFLDYRLVELGLSIPSKLKLKNGNTKNILRQIGKDILPKSVIAAPKKGFGIPLNNYLYKNGELKSFIKDKLIQLGNSDWFEWEKYENRILLDNTNKKNPIYLYRLLCLQIWKDKNNIV